MTPLLPPMRMQAMATAMGDGAPCRSTRYHQLALDSRVRCRTRQQRMGGRMRNHAHASCDCCDYEVRGRGLWMQGSTIITYALHFI